ncbi:MAG: calmodulin-binding protein [Pirellulales bacterium]
MLRQTMLTLGCALGVSVGGLFNVARAQDESEEMTPTSTPAIPVATSTGLPVSAYGGAPIPIGYQSAAGSMAYGRQWVHTYGTQDWERFYHYPYVFYPQNFWGSEYYRSSESLYHRYPNEMRIPVYNKQWHNYYPEAANWDRNITGRYKAPPTGGRYHMGHHFILDTF